MSEAERELEKIFVQNYQYKHQLFDNVRLWREKHSPRVPSDEDIEKVFWKHHFSLHEISRHRPLIKDILALMHPKPEWCKSDCPDPWKWHKDSFGRLSKQPCGVVVVAPHIEFCDCCGAQRPQCH